MRNLSKRKRKTINLCARARVSYLVCMASNHDSTAPALPALAPPAHVFRVWVDQATERYQVTANLGALARRSVKEDPNDFALEYSLFQGIKDRLDAWWLSFDEPTRDSLRQRVAVDRPTLYREATLRGA